MADEGKIVGILTPKNFTRENERSEIYKDATILALKKEIDILKEENADQAYIIEDLAAERDERSSELYEVRLILADAWSIERYSDAEKIREVLRRTDEITSKKVNTQPSIDAVILSGCQAATVSAEKKANNDYREGAIPDWYDEENLQADISNEVKSTCALSQKPSQRSYCDAVKETNMFEPNKMNGTDSGIDLHSLEKLIDERISAKIDTRFETKSANTTTKQNPIKDIMPIFTTNEFENPITPTTDTRKLNVIIHGIKEEDITDSRDPVLNELFETLQFVHHAEIKCDRLGAKSIEKTRPIRIKMESSQMKEVFMSSLWKLKNGPIKFQKISVTDDYTQDERREIKRWVNEAKQRTKDEVDYEWKVRGSPKNGLRLVKMETLRSHE